MIRSSAMFYVKINLILVMSFIFDVESFYFHTHNKTTRSREFLFARLYTFKMTRDCHTKRKRHTKLKRFFNTEKRNRITSLAKDCSIRIDFYLQLF